MATGKQGNQQGGPRAHRYKWSYGAPCKWVTGVLTSISGGIPAPTYDWAGGGPTLKVYEMNPAHEFG